MNAIKIQSIFRRHRAIQIYEKEKRAANKIIYFWRNYVALNKTNRARRIKLAPAIAREFSNVAIKLGTFKLITGLYLKEYYATIIQKHWRGFNSRSSSSPRNNDKNIFNNNTFVSTPSALFVNDSEAFDPEKDKLFNSVFAEDDLDD